MLGLVSSTESRYSVVRGSLGFPIAVPAIARYVEVDSLLSVDRFLIDPVGN
jgi:hypothetical protein